MLAEKREKQTTNVLVLCNTNGVGSVQTFGLTNSTKDSNDPKNFNTEEKLIDFD